MTKTKSKKKKRSRKENRCHAICTTGERCKNPIKHGNMCARHAPGGSESGSVYDGFNRFMSSNAPGVLDEENLLSDMEYVQPHTIVVSTESAPRCGFLRTKSGKAICISITCVILFVGVPGAIFGQ